MKVFKRDNHGFTLVELLIAISIIGLLSAIILVSLKSSREKASDAAIKENLIQIRPIAELLYSNNPDYPYTNLFASGSNAFNAFNNALSLQGGSSGAWSRGEASIPQYSTWSAWVGLRTDPTAAWCVDSTGVSRKVSVPAGEVDSCPPAIP